MELRKSNRELARIRMALQGPSGSGKTYTALQVAYGLCKDWNRIAVIDTENRSADLYCHLGPYKVLNLGPPFSPERYIQALDVCEKSGVDVIIVDSLSAEWEGEGGILDIHSQMVGNSFNNWGKVLPSHNTLIQRILRSGKHVIVTVRSKQEYVLSEKNGKMVPQLVGMQGIQRNGLEYDFTIVFDLDINHNVTCTKDRTQLFNKKVTFKADSSTGQTIKKWCDEAEPMSQLAAEKLINACNSTEELHELYKSTPAIRSYSLTFNLRSGQLIEKREAARRLRQTNHA